MARQDSIAVSAALAAAQEQLHQRRQQRRRERIEQELPVHTDSHGRSLLPYHDSTQNKGYRPGWECQTLTRALRAHNAAREERAAREVACSLAWLPAPTRPALPASKPRGPVSAEHTSASLTLYPDLAIAMLRENLVAVARIWLLLRYLDQPGCGWIDAADARKQLTGRESSLRVCSSRHLRTLLAQGEDIFWERNGRPGSTERIWLRSSAKVALALNTTCLNKRPVTIPLAILLGAIGTLRAHFFASFHSGRNSEKPIARQTVADLTGVARRSQIAYEKKAGVKKQHNWVIGSNYSETEAQRRSWEHGHAVFQLTDYDGKSGATGQTYVAWQLPNSYQGPHTPQTKTYNKRINRRLTDLLNKGITGNGEEKVEEPTSQDAGSKGRYYEHGRAAARAYNCDASNDLYWRTPTSYRRYQIWHLLPGQTEATA